MYAPLHVSSGFHLFLRSMGKRFPSGGDCRDGKTFETSAEKSLPTVCFLPSSSFVVSFLSTTDSSSLHVFSLLSQPHIFLFHLNYLLLLAAPSTSRPPPPLPPTSLLFVVAKLYRQPVGDTAEGGRLHLPVVDGVGEQADAVVEHPLHAEASRAEVIHAHVVDVVGVEVHHLQGQEDAEGDSANKLKALRP